MKNRSSKKRELVPGELVRRRRKEDPGSKELRINLRATNRALKKARDGSPKGWEDLFTLLDRFRPGLIRCLRFWLKAKWQDAEDAVSDLFVTLLEEVRDGSFKKPCRGRWWAGLFSRAKRRWRMNLARARRQTPLVTTEPDPDAFLESQAITNDPQAEDLEFEDEIEGSIKRAGAKLKPKQRQIFCARLRGLSHGEIAEMLHTTPGSARVQYREARLTLQAAMPEVARTLRTKPRRKARRKHRKVA